MTGMHDIITSGVIYDFVNLNDKFIEKYSILQNYLSDGEINQTFIKTEINQTVKPPVINRIKAVFSSS